MAVSNLDAIARRALTRHFRSSACAAADFNDVTLALLLVVLETQQVSAGQWFEARAATRNTEPAGRSLEGSGKSKRSSNKHSYARAAFGVRASSRVQSSPGPTACLRRMLRFSQRSGNALTEQAYILMIVDVRKQAIGQ